MRVLVITNDLPPRVGGIQYYVDQLARGLAGAGDQVLMYGSTFADADAWDADAPFDVVRDPTSTLLPTPGVRRRSVALVQEFGADIVVFGAAVPLAWMGSMIERRTGVPFVAFTHGLEVSAVRMPGSGPPLRAIGRHAGAVTFVSNWCRDLLRPAFGDGPRFDLLPPGVDDREFHRGVSGADVRARYELEDRPVVVCVSRLVERKGQDQLIRALPQLRQRAPGAALLVVGGGPHRAALESLARSQGVAAHVHFTGVVSEDELPAHYAAGDVFAMPCRERRGGLEVEAFGIVFIQAQAVGVPVVAGNIGGVPDAVGGPDTGTLVDGRDLPAVIDAVGDLLSDPDRARTMGDAGARRVASEFTWTRRTAQLQELLADVAGAGTD